ncbi:hypothetical protein ACHAPH_006270 [Verticillium nonalfalfae]
MLGASSPSPTTGPGTGTGTGIGSKGKAVCVACRARKKGCNVGRSMMASRHSHASSAVLANGHNLSHVPRHSNGQQLQFQPYPMPSSMPHYPYPQLSPSTLQQMNPGLIQTISGLVATPTPDSEQSPLYYSFSPQETSASPPGNALDLTAMLFGGGGPGHATATSTPYAAASHGTAFPFPQPPAHPASWLPASLTHELPSVGSSVGSSISSSVTGSVFDDRDRAKTSQQSSVHSPQTPDPPPDAAPSSEPGHPESETSHSPAVTATAHLPDRRQSEELCSIFFQRFYIHLPIFSKERLSAALSTAATAASARRRPLPYALFALVAANHTAADVQAQQTGWYDVAKHLYGQTSHIPDEPLQTLQAAACIVLHALVVGDHSTAWLVLGKAWRQCVALGFNQMDSTSSAAASTLLFVDWRELEERRRTMWTLFMLDRGMCFPIGMAHSIDERQLRVNLPMGEDTVQNSEAVPSQSGVLFTPNFRKLLSLVGAQQTGPNVFHYLIISYVLLGRIVEHMYWPESDDDDEDDAQRHESMLGSLQEDLSQMRLMLPRSATDLANAAHSDFTYVVWLNVMMNVNTVFLFHRPPTRRLEQGSHDEDMVNGEDGSSRSATSNWELCVAVARKTAMLIREASRVSTDLLMNPMIAAPTFTCARILVIEHLLSSAPLNSGGGRVVRTSSGFVADLQVLLLMFDRLSESFSGVGAKFRSGVLYHLKQGPENAREIKAAGSKELLESCAKWRSAVDGDDGTKGGAR